MPDPSGQARRFLLERVFMTALVVTELVPMVVTLAGGGPARELLLLLFAVSAGVSALFPGTVTRIRRTNRVRRPRGGGGGNATLRAPQRAIGLLGSQAMAQSDRHIAEKDRCPTCKGAGWTWFEGEPEGKWIVCRECIGTGRADQKGRKRTRPDEAA